jgi:hypothetical protein
MTTSSIPAITDALIALLEAATWPGVTPQILDGEHDEAWRECVIVGDTFGSSQREWSTLGAQHMIERYAITVAIRAGAPGQEMKQARDRVYALWSVVDQALRDAIPNRDTTIFIEGFNGLGSNVLEVRLDRPEHRNVLLDEGWGAEIVTSVAVQAQT